jgi:tetratricopeptide (TPR) repeat protein
MSNWVGQVRRVGFVGHLLMMLAAAAVQGTQTPKWDYTAVRADMFAGLAGDADRFARAMEACERTLAHDPAHPEALVWHGSGLFFQAGQAFQRGDAAKAQPLWDRGLAEMNEAVSRAPDSLAVVIPRGAVLLQAARFTPPAIARPLLETGVRDYEHVLELQKTYFHTLGDHPKGELLFGLADGYARLGNAAKARAYFERLVADAPGSGQTPRGRAWLETGVVPDAKGLGCFGCHK